MKLIAEYLEHERQFKKLAACEKRVRVKAEHLKQAAAYRKRAEQRARDLGVPAPQSALLDVV